ncbi:transcriptional regulator [Actinomadura craniellae]|uniref:Transcriptional regulator n=1 Tax=Actinomadura craniellae TaxID=2231787 RepID=A0A365H8U1_9ACTN|nr:helix-turn-helix transcriptional regulator [Actinomadura craniellae]RAY14673.1 transcriptional regulator [Actinomadura craniellae]
MREIQAGGYSPTIKKRALSRKLVALREQCGMTTSEVCKRLHWSPSKLNYIEKAKWIDPNSDSVADLCELYGVDGADRDALIRLTREARQRGWWRKYNDVFTSELPGFEAGASSIRTFQNTVVPGLLQVPEYIEMITRIAGIEEPAEIKRRTDARLERQKILLRDQRSCHLHAVVDEHVLLRIGDKGVRSAQIAHLLKLAQRPNVEVQVIPLEKGLYPGAGETFTCLMFPDSTERDIVYLETTVDGRMLEEPDELERYMVRFDRLRTVAMDFEATRAYLARQIE